MRSEELDLAAVTDHMGVTRDSLRGDAAGVARDAGLTLETWQEGLGRVAGPARGHAPDTARRAASLLGLEAEARSLTWVVRQQPIHGYAGILEVPDDVRIMIRPNTSLHGLGNVLHELGHALAHRCNRADG
ncbi:MAG: hypothetical protein ACE5GC_04180, partial [Acidimicrobiia bacterium]